MNVVDSSGWLEYFAGTARSELFAPAIEDTDQLVVPSLTLFEVYKRVHLQRSETAALNAVATMQQARVVDLDAQLALAAARLSASTRLPLADSIILATARATESMLWTQDADFEGMEGVRYLAR